MRTSFNKKFILFLLVLFVMGIITGLGYFNFFNADLKSTITTSFHNFILNINEIKINNIIPHGLFISFLIITSFLVIGLPICLFYLFYNGFLVGFVIRSFTFIKGFKGFIFSLVYLLITKVIYLFFLFLLIMTLIKLSIKIIRKDNFKKEKIFILSKRSLLCFIIIFLNDLFLYFGGGKILNIFNFLIN